MISSNSENNSPIPDLVVVTDCKRLAITSPSFLTGVFMNAIIPSRTTFFAYRSIHIRSRLVFCIQSRCIVIDSFHHLKDLPLRFKTALRFQELPQYLSWLGLGNCIFGKSLLDYCGHRILIYIRNMSFFPSTLILCKSVTFVTF